MTPTWVPRSERATTSWSPWAVRRASGPGDIEIPPLDRHTATEILIAEPAGIERDLAGRYAAHARP